MMLLMISPGSPVRVDEDTRIAAFDCDRLGRMYQVEVRFGPVEFQAHGGPHHDYADALAQAHRVARRERDTREDRYVAAEPDHQPDSYAFREARLAPTSPAPTSPESGYLKPTYLTRS